jgi:N-acetylmuramoyl-L-alanine amidase
VFTRRLLLGFGASATFLLPGVLSAGSALADKSVAGRVPLPAPVRPGTLPVVMLDPGHGGKDPGAIGITGTYEKQVALASAQELKRQLEASGRYRVVLSRTRDVFIPLEERVALAQRHEASLFVSMHADALHDHGVRGASVYTLAEHASDAQTAALALRENAADRFAGPDFHATSPEVARILASLVRQETRTGSARMARSVVGEMGRDVPLLQNPSRHAGFVVLKAADIPSVLVEMGFMSNKQDEAALRQPAHRARVATAMHRAIDAYFAQAGGPRPPSTRMAG